MTADEHTSLLRESPQKRWNGCSSANRVLIAGFLISGALGFTQVPILYVFRLMACEEYYRHTIYDGSGNRCNRNEIDSSTATQVSILGLSTTFCGVLNLFFTGWHIKRWGPRNALVTQMMVLALRAITQALGVMVGAKEGIIIVQCSQFISLVGGNSGYLLTLNTAAGEVVGLSDRTAMFGKLQGSVMLGTSLGYLLGGIIGDAWGVRRPFEVAAILFTISSAYAAMFLPYIDPRTLRHSETTVKSKKWTKIFEGLQVLAPKKLQLGDGQLVTYCGTTFLALGVFTGVLATGYAPILIQMYATAAFDFQPTQNGYLMATNSLIRGIFLIFFFPKIISLGRRWFALGNAKKDTYETYEPIATSPEDLDPVIGVPSEQEPAVPIPPVREEAGEAFDLFFLRWSLVIDGLVTASTAFATTGTQIYIAGFLLPLASGSAPASKGIITEMCKSSERTDALQAITLVENVAMLSTLGLFGFIFAALSDVGKAYVTFYCNAALALASVLPLLMAKLPPQHRKIDNFEENESTDDSSLEQ